MSKPKIAIIIGSTRDSRFGEKPAKWIYEIAAARDRAWSSDDLAEGLDAFRNRRTPTFHGR